MSVNSQLQLFLTLAAVITVSGPHLAPRRAFALSPRRGEGPKQCDKSASKLSEAKSEYASERANESHSVRNKWSTSIREIKNYIFKTFINFQSHTQNKRLPTTAYYLIRRGRRELALARERERERVRLYYSLEIGGGLEGHSKDSEETETSTRSRTRLFPISGSLKSFKLFSVVNFCLI